MSRMYQRCSDTTALIGQSIVGISARAGYWNVVLSLQSESGEMFEFFSHAINVQHHFEIFAIDWRAVPDADINFEGLKEKYIIKEIHALWRGEWLAPVQPHADHLGSGPHHEHSVGLVGIAPTSAIAEAIVLAGVHIIADSGSSILVHASPDAPMNIDGMIKENEIEETIQRLYGTRHELRI